MLASAAEASAPPPAQPLSPSAAAAPTRTVVIVVVSCLVLAALVLAAYRGSLGSALGIVAGAGKTADTSTLSLWDSSSSPSKASANDPSLWDPASVSTVSTIGSTATAQHRADAAQLIASSLLEYEKSAKAAAAKAAAATATAAAAAVAAANTATTTSTTTTTTTTTTSTTTPTAPPSPSPRPAAMAADLIAAAKAWRSLDMDRNGAPSTLGGNILKRAEGVEGAYGVYVLHPDVVRESSGGPTIGVNLLPTPQATCSMEAGVDSVDPAIDASAAGARSFADNPFLTHFADHVYHMCHPHTFGATFSAMVFTVSGPGAASATAGVATSISVAYTNTPMGTQVDLAMRLVGPSIVALEKPGSQQGPPSPQTGTYTVREPGMYVLEVLLSFVGGRHANHLVYRGLVHVAAKEGGIAAAFKDANGVDIRGTKRCAGGWVAEKPGRWVYIGVPAGALPAPHDGAQPSDGGAKLTPPHTKTPSLSKGSTLREAQACPLPYCNSSRAEPNAAYWRKWTDDQVGYSRGYVWAPWDCHYYQYTRDDIKTCFDQCGFRGKLSNSGDSLGREVLTAEMAMADISGIDGRRYKVDVKREIESEILGTVIWDNWQTIPSGHLHVQGCELPPEEQFEVCAGLCCPL